MAAVAGALSGKPGDVASSVVADVTMAKPDVPHVHNH
jgi:hypothetical protein